MNIEAPHSATTKPRRRWLQFSLRTLLLLMVPVACLAAWLGRGGSSLYSRYGVAPGSLMMEHMQYYVGSTGWDPAASEDLARDILVALRTNDEEALTLEEFYGEGFVQMQSPLRDRDFWAFVLADLIGEELVIFAFDDAQTRDAKIDELLNKIESQSAEN